MKKLLLRFIKTKHFWFCLVLPIAITLIFYSLVFQIHDYIEARDARIKFYAYEAGRLDQLNEDFGNNEAEKREFILNKLQELESKNCTVRKILDFNNVYSLGCFHFQAKSVQDLYLRYYKQKITIEQAIKIAEDDELSRQLAYDAIFIYGEKFHWKLSFCRMANRGLVDYKCELKNSKFSLK